MPIGTCVADTGRKDDTSRADFKGFQTVRYEGGLPFAKLYQGMLAYSLISRDFRLSVMKVDYISPRYIKGC